MQLLEAFKSFINKENLFSPKEKLLVAVSGGLDSVVLCELCCQAGFDFFIAHCNFQLRGEESMRDERFVRDLGKRYGKEVIVERFDTEKYAAAEKCSIQVAARQLRYDWFLRLHTGPVLTAHHQDDNIETLLMNFFKGTGIAGLRAMLPRQGNIVRPLLFATREMLRQFAGGQGLTWVEDSSNASDKYTRNYFRHQLIPVLQTIYPDVMKNLGGNINRFREVEMLYKQAVEEQKRRLLEHKGDEVHIPVLKLQRSKPLPTLVYEIIQDFGFSARQVPAVMDLLDSGPGKYVMSDTHRILKDRNRLIISLHKEAPADHVLVEQGQKKVLFEEGALEFQLLTGAEPSSDPMVAWLDASAIQYPLLLRKWRPGD
ncbi:MAG TPA: tRNA lysidine(34) synthetase TilS, partial [Puia sp.]|nr:tRNA lysidine(34) synthetase TilS [Puia sp.]